MSETLFDPVRQKPVPATPEEKVRQQVIHYLLHIVKVPISLIGVEYSLSNLEKGNAHRMDIIVWKPGGKQLTPWLLVETKAPHIPITDTIVYQLAEYLRLAPSAYLMLSNGKDTRILKWNNGAYGLISSLPFFNS